MKGPQHRDRGNGGARQIGRDVCGDGREPQNVDVQHLAGATQRFEILAVDVERVFSSAGSEIESPSEATLVPLGSSVYRASKEFSKRANNAAGPGNISTHPACRSDGSVNPPQSTPMVAILAFPAASAS